MTTRLFLWTRLLAAWLLLASAAAFVGQHLPPAPARLTHPHGVSHGRNPRRSPTLLRAEPVAATPDDSDAKPALENVNPAWRDILEIPIRVDTQAAFDKIPLAKRLAIVSRVSVLHLTLLSCGGPFVLRGALGRAPLHPLLAALFTLDGLSWHVVHNMLNDWQDLDDDDDTEDSFRLAYGCHALKQGFLSKKKFLGLMGLLALPGLVLTQAFRGTVLGPAAGFGIVALFFYTILFKPLALGEVAIYLVWGPLMAGFGQLAAGAPWTGAMSLFTDPAVALFGLAGFGVIMGKHTDKITRSRKKTLPKVLGIENALRGCKLTLMAPHALLLWTFYKERVAPLAASGTSVVPTVPLGAALAFLTLFREFPAAMRAMALGPVRTDRPNMPWGTKIKGTIIDANVDRAWPLWFVAFMGWHAITFAYLMVIGSGAEWMGKVLLARFGLL